MSNLYEALENCLHEIERGADTETVIRLYPDIADELRPILQTSVKARARSVSVPSAEVLQRNRARLLQRAAELREVRAGLHSRRVWFVSLRRVAVTLAVLAVVFASGTGLVRAAAMTLPGDNLYPVKRTWEDVKLLFTFDAQKHASLEVEYENERLDELRGLMTEGRSAQVTFAGLVTRKDAAQWQIAGFSVVISSQTHLPGEPVQVGSAVRVIGITQGSSMIVRAESVKLLPLGASLPNNVEPENHEESNQPGGGDSGTGSEGEATQVQATNTPEPDSVVQEESFQGVVDSMDGDLWIINGVSADVSAAEIIGTPGLGAAVIVEGYYNSDGVFVVTKIEFLNNGSNSSGNTNSSGSDSNDGQDDGSNSNSNNNEHENENSNDHGGGDHNGNEYDNGSGG